MKRLFSVAAISTLCGVAGFSLWQQQQTVLESSTLIQQKVSHPYHLPGYSNVSGSYLAARFAASNGDAENALQQISRAIAYSKSPDINILDEAYQLSLMTGDFERALQYANKLPSNRLDVSLSPSMLRLVAAIRMQNHEKALEISKTAEANHINRLFLPLINGWVQLANQQHDENFTNLTKLASEQGEFQSLIKYQLALLFDAAGEQEKAHRLYNDVAESENLSHRILWALANFYHRAGDKIRLEEVQQRHLEEYGVELPPAGKTPLVTNAAEGVAEIFYGIGSILYALQALDEAKIPLNLAQYLRPDFPSVQLLTANIKDQNGQYEEAIEAYKGIRNHALFADKARLRSALAYNSMGNMDAALKLLDQFIAEKPNALDALLTKADILRSNKKFADAIAYYNKAIEQIETPTARHWSIFYARGICQERTNQWPEAEADFLEALRLEEDQPDVLNYLGYSWLIQGKHITQAKEMIEKAMLARPRDAHIIDSMGWALYHLGQFEEARDHLEQAIDIAPRDPTLNEHLGDIYWQLGMKLQARFQWERALFFEPEEEGQQEGIELKLSKGLEAHEPSRPRMLTAQGESKANGIKLEANAPNLQSTQ
jgi:tetratricopeptide (TPR) repeat protein